jgi:hypothetical protein
MEIHHHSHTPGKKWTHYFWEFFMLFLAVFCGFLAEYQLEHIFERKKELQYIKSYIEDLSFDTSSFNNQISIRIIKQRRIDSLIPLIKSPDRNNYTRDIYLYAQTVQRGGIFEYHDRTIRQLINSGGMRLIHEKNPSDSITLYDSRIRKMQYFEEREADTRNNYRIFVGLLFDASVLHSMIDGIGLQRPEGTPKLFTEDPGIINQLCIQAYYLRTSNQVILVYLELFKQNAIDLIKFLKKEYHLK